MLYAFILAEADDTSIWMIFLDVIGRTEGMPTLTQNLVMPFEFGIQNKNCSASCTFYLYKIVARYILT
jgi:hypothetical protein